jgi:hypothetical protein
MKRAATIAFLFLAAAALPARAQISVVGAGVEERQARAGESYSGTVRLRNDGAEAAEARLYLTDYAFAADGSTRYGPAGSSPRSNAGWVTFTPSHVRIAPGTEATVGYTVTVPAGEKAGTFWSMLMVEGIARGAPESTAVAARGTRAEMGVRPTIRYGVQIATTLGAGERRADFAGTRAVGTEGGKRIELDVVNSGEVAYRPELSIELYDESGAAVKTFSSRRGLLYPGTSLRQSFDLGALPAGTYQALVTADTGGDEVFGAQYRLKL